MDEEDFKDIPKKYSGTYFQYRSIDSKEPWKTCYAEEIRIWYAETDKQVNYFMVKFDGRWLKSIEYEFKFDFPPIGVLNYKETIVIANKYPARQWKKAITTENFVVYFPTNSILSILSDWYKLPEAISYEFTWDVESVKELFNNKFFSYKQALLELQSGKRLACAITPEFFVTNSHYNESVLLWRYNIIIAEIHDDSILYVESMFEQEAIDFFKRNT